jgi:GT2 family glycosyltransferase
MRDARVTVVVANWNGREFLDACLESVFAQQVEGGVRVVVIDNGSTDGSQDHLRSHWPEVELIESATNNYTAANNRGVAMAQGEYALLLNTDAVLAKGCLQSLVRALVDRPDAAAAAPKIVYPDGRICTTGIEQRDDLYWVDRDGAKVDEQVTSPPTEVLGVSGCCALYRVAAWLDVGGQDEAFHMYYEDVDLALALRRAGNTALYVSAARCTHVGHGSIRKAAKWKDELGERNRLLVLARHFPGEFAHELVRSPWFQSASPDEVSALLPLCAERLADGGEHLDHGDVMLSLMMAMRDQVRDLSGELDSRWGEHRNLPKILDERERWIGKLLLEVARLRVWRLPGRRLKQGERDFLARLPRE